MTINHGRLMRLPEVLDITGVSKSSLYEMIRQARFPAPVGISVRAVGWRSEDVDVWLKARQPAHVPSGQEG